MKLKKLSSHLSLKGVNEKEGQNIGYGVLGLEKRGQRKDKGTEEKRLGNN